MADKPDQNKEEQEQNAREQRALELLDQLEKREDFQEWRDLVAKPQVDQLEVEIKGPQADLMSEGVFRGKVKHYFSVKNLFYDIFEQARDILRDKVQEGVKNK